MEAYPSLEDVESERLCYRLLTLEDIEPWMEFHRAPEAVQVFGYDLNERGPCEDSIRRQMARYEADGSGFRAVCLKGQNDIIGMCGFNNLYIDGQPEVEIGYRFLPRFWGKGYASEAARTCMEQAFADPKTKSLISLITADNESSWRVAMRNGLKKEGQTTFKGFTVDIWRIWRNAG